jgi:hypothetical protein
LGKNRVLATGLHIIESVYTQTLIDIMRHLHKTGEDVAWQKALCAVPLNASVKGKMNGHTTALDTVLQRLQQRIKAEPKESATDKRQKSTFWYLRICE